MSPMSPRLLRPRATGFTPRNLSGLVAWFDADDAGTFTLSGTEISEWRDKSGNGYAVSQSTVNNRPARTGTLRGRATVDFDGTNDCLFSDGTGLAAAYDGDKSITAFCVGEMHNTAEYAVNPQGTWLAFASSGSGTPFFYIRSGAGAGTLNIAVRNDSSNSNGTISTPSSGPAGNLSSGNGDFFICSATSPSQGFSVARVHNTLTNTGDSITPPRNQQGALVTSASARAAGATTSNRFTVGALGRNSFGDFFPARISEIVIYSRVLSDAERARVVNYLGKKYNLATPVI